MFIGVDTHRSTESLWYCLYLYMDGDGSGLITYPELLKMMREDLQLKPMDVTNDHVKSVWRALDTDNCAPPCPGHSNPSRLWQPGARTAPRSEAGCR